VKRDKYSTGWSTQRDRHGAFKLKPSEARFQLVIDKADADEVTAAGDMLLDICNMFQAYSLD